MNKCLICNVSFNRKCDLKRHESSQKHQKNLNNPITNLNEIKNIEQPDIHLYCKICNKQYVKKFYYDKHIQSKSHILNIQKLNKENDYRVPVINIETKIVKYGKNAPLKSKLENFLEKYPKYEIYNKDKIKNYNSFLLKLKSELLNIIILIDKEIN